MTTIRRRSLLKLAGAAGLAGALAPAGRASAADPTWYTSVQGPDTPTMTSFDDAMLGFMKAHGITCGSLAVTTGGRLVKTSGYTVSSRWLPVGSDLVQPTSLFRIASITKPITATAISRLAQEGRLDLDAPIGSLVDLTPLPGWTGTEHLDQVTLRFVLEHRGGWGDPSVTGFDPMFADNTIADAVAQAFGTTRTLPVTQRQIIQYNSGRALDNTPGQTFAYSNYGYLLLGRVIETVTGMAYADYVQQAVLGPMGITRMRLGHTTTLLDRPTEFPYNTSLGMTHTVIDNSDSWVQWPRGGFNLENMDSHGGWLAGAMDLVRFASIFDLPAQQGGVLNQASVTETFAPPNITIPQNDAYYGYGWFVRPTSGGVGYNSWHNGSLPGSWTWLVRCYNGWSWAALFNQRDDPNDRNDPNDPNSPQPSTYLDIDSVLWNAAYNVDSWPAGDLYPQFFPAA
jgi:CubicO group peptidase (beta-lactamase class C family)